MKAGIFIAAMFWGSICFGQSSDSPEIAIEYLNNTFIYSRSFSLSPNQNENAEFKLKSIKIENDRIRIVESEVSSASVSDDDTLSKEIYIPLKSIKKVRMVYDFFLNQPPDGLLEITYRLSGVRWNKHKYLYFKWNAEKDLKDNILSAFNQLIEANQKN